MVYVAKIYDGDAENLNFTVMNLERRDLTGTSLFFFKVYAGNTLVVDESSSSWECKTGFRVSHGIRIMNLQGPDEYLMRAELYWRNQTTVVLEDSREFKILVVKLFVASWSQSISTIQLGARVPSTLVVSFQNGGNDKMLSVAISLNETSGLLVDPQARNIGDMPAGQTTKAEFSVSAPISISMGPRVLTFEVMYADFRGVSHRESVSATLVVTKLGAGLNLYVSEKMKYSYPIEISTRLLDANGDPIKDQTLKFYILSESTQRDIGTNITDSSGYAKIVDNEVLDVGNYQVKVLYEGSASHNSTVATMGITIIPIPTKLLFNIPSSMVVGQTVNVTVQLSDEMDKPVPGQVIQFYSDNEKFGNSTTNENGFASALHVPGRKGSIQLRIVYDGEHNFAQSEWSGTLTIEAIRTTLKLFTQSFALQGDNLVIKATLRDTTGTPIQSAPLNFTITTGDTKIDQTLPTDNEGLASLSFKTVTSDTIRVDVLYTGDLRYDTSQASATITVFSPLLLAGVTVAVMIAVIMSIFGLMKFKLGLDPISWIRDRLGTTILQGRQTPHTKPVAPQAVVGRLAHCPACDAPMQETETACRNCGRTREVLPAQSDLDERVYSYIIEHSGVISLRQAASDLGISPEKVKESAERLKQSGRLG